MPYSLCVPRFTNPPSSIAGSVSGRPHVVNVASCGQWLSDTVHHIPRYRQKSPVRNDANVDVESTWTPTIHHVYVTADGVILSNLSWKNFHSRTAIEELISVAWLKSTLPSMTRNFAYDHELALRQFARLNSEYGLYTYVRPKALQSTSSKYDSDTSDNPCGFLVPPVQHLDSGFRGMVAANEEATIVISQWTKSSCTLPPSARALSTKYSYHPKKRMRLAHPGPFWPATVFIAMMTNRKTGKWTATLQNAGRNTTSALAPHPPQHGKQNRALSGAVQPSSLSSRREPSLVPNSCETLRARVFRTVGDAPDVPPPACARRPRILCALKRAGTASDSG